MTDRRPEAVYGILVRDARVFLVRSGTGLALPGGVFRPMAEDRKVELKAHLEDQLGIKATRIWAQGAFRFRNSDEGDEQFAGFYSVWDWEGELRPGIGEWLDEEAVAASALPASAKILLTSVRNTTALRTT